MTEPIRPLAGVDLDQRPAAARATPPYRHRVGRARLYSSALLVGVAAVIVYALLVASPREVFALDLHQYLEAADKVIHLESPYHDPATPIEGLYAYAYPPLLAFGFAPWLLLPIGPAEYLAVVLYLVAILAALWLCGVR